MNKKITIDQSDLQLILMGVVMNIMNNGLNGIMDRIEPMAKMIIDDLYKNRKDSK